MRVLFAGLGILATLAACHVSVGGNDNDDHPGIAAQGSGNSRTYAADGFTAVDLRGADDIDVRVGPAFSVRADGDPKVLDSLRIWKEGNTLHVGRVSRVSWGFSSGHARITVTLPALAAASIAGSGDISIDRVQGAAFTGESAGSGNISVGAMQVEQATLSLAGSGDAKLAGSATRLKIEIAGSGDVDAGGLTAREADVSIAGSGNVRAAVDGPAKVTIMGSGDVDLGGKAHCTSTKMGSGTIRCGA